MKLGFAGVNFIVVLFVVFLKFVVSFCCVWSMLTPSFALCCRLAQLFCLRQFQLNYVSSLFSIPDFVVLNLSSVNGQSH